jgi:hypothetical protein
MRFVETQATPAEALEAFTWTTAQIGTELGLGPRGAVAHFEILKREELEPDER